MDGTQTLKKRLPFPYNQDLSQVVRRLNRRTPFSRNKLANDPVTAAYLAAAMRLIEHNLGPCAQRTPIDPEDDNSVERPLLGFLSQRAVAAEVANNPDPFPRMGSVSTMRSTWRSHSDFIADLLSFGLWSKSQPFWENEEVIAAIEQLIDGADFVQAVHDLGSLNLVIFLVRPRFRLQLVAAAAAEGDDVIREVMAEHYKGALEPWKLVLGELFRARKLRLRPGITPDDFINLLAAVTEGMALRALADPRSEAVNHTTQRSTLGTAALALILGCLQRADDVDGLPLEQAVHALVHAPSQPGLGPCPAEALAKSNGRGK